MPGNLFAPVGLIVRYADIRRRNTCLAKRLITDAVKKMRVGIAEAEVREALGNLSAIGSHDGEAVFERGSANIGSVGNVFESNLCCAQVFFVLGRQILK